MKYMNTISVIIPTYNRKETLLRCLQHYELQSFPLDRFEIIVVDDGSTDGTWEMLNEFQGKLKCRLSCHRKENGGPGPARNLGIRNAAGEVLLIIGDDIFPDVNLLSEHFAWHSERYPDDNAGGLGFVTWDENPPASPFMIWLERGYQNAYHLIHHQEEVHWRFSYTGNISLKRAFLEGTREWFDERRLSYGYEDIEWGYRLQKKGFRLFYNENAIGYHHHWQTMEHSLKRAQQLGRSAKLLQNINREIYDRILIDLVPEGRWKRFLLDICMHPILAESLFLPLAKFLEHRKSNSYIFALSHLYYFKRGLTETEPPPAP
jgi:glycosyltransferase involved in cell wall biosynthesis